MSYFQKLGFHLLLIVAGIILSLWNSWIGKWITIVYLFLVLYISPFTKRRENIWMFLMVICIFIPLNQPIIHYVMDFFSDWKLFGYFIIAAVWTIEQILFGVITRIIWPNQKTITIQFKKGGVG